jgi:hypothetical protein
VSKRILKALSGGQKKTKSSLDLQAPDLKCTPAVWGGSSAGRALRSQCRGREFDPPPLHQRVHGLVTSATAVSRRRHISQLHDSMLLLKCVSSRTPRIAEPQRSNHNGGTYSGLQTKPLITNNTCIDPHCGLLSLACNPVRTSPRCRCTLKPGEEFWSA